MSSPEEVGFAVLSRKFRRSLLDFFIRRTGSRIDAEDMVQDVFMRLAALRDLGPIYCGQGLLFRIASNLMLDRQRRNTVRTRAKLEQDVNRSEEHTSELPVTNAHLVCRILLEKKKNTQINTKQTNTNN